jgi:hypothetical protein
MGDDEQGGQGGGQGGDNDGGGQGNQQSNDPGDFDAGVQIRRRDPGGLTRKAAPEGPALENSEPEPTPDPDDPGEFEVGYLTEERRRPKR